MMKIVHAVTLLLFHSLLLAAERAPDHILPLNLSLRWISDFEPELSWEPPKLSGTKCTYLVNIEPGDKVKSIFNLALTTEQYSEHVIMEGGSLHWSVRALCNGSTSEEAISGISYPELVKDLDCYSFTATNARCSWSRTSNAPDLRFFYQYAHFFTHDADAKEKGYCVSRLVHETDGTISELLEGYPNNVNDVQADSDLEATVYHTIYIMFNGTWNNTSVRNTFERSTFYNVKLPRLMVNVTKRGNKLHISWVAPEIFKPSSWKYRINHTKCNQMEELTVEEFTSYELNVAPRCRHCISVVAESSSGSTPPSERVCVDADVDRGNVLYIVIILPLLLACITLSIIVWFNKNKDSIFPKIPQPRDCLSDISNNNIESSHFYWYFPEKEEVSCKVTLVADT